MNAGVTQRLPAALLEAEDDAPGCSEAAERGQHAGPRVQTAGGEGEEDGAGLGGQELPIQPQHLASRGHRGQGGSLSAPGSGQRRTGWRPGRSSYDTVLSNLVLLCPVFAFAIVMTRQNTLNCTCANG